MNDIGQVAATTADAVTIEIVKGALRAALAETEALLARTSMSDVIRENKDYFTGFFDFEGRIVAGTPIPLLAHVIDPILEQYPAETMRPGDIYWYNDCYGSGGGVSHLNDQVFAAPVFTEGKLSGLTQLDSTTVLFPGQTAEVHDFGSLIVREG